MSLNLYLFDIPCSIHFPWIFIIDILLIYSENPRICFLLEAELNCASLISCGPGLICFLNAVIEFEKKGSSIFIGGYLSKSGIGIGQQWELLVR